MTPQVAVLIGVYNGAPHLEAQLHSLTAQTLPPSLILVSDDGSTDGSGEILDRFASTCTAEVIRLRGPQAGLAANYLHLIRQCPPCDLVALCDQDDVWLPEKLAHQWQRLRDVTGLRSGQPMTVRMRDRTRRPLVCRDVEQRHPHGGWQDGNLQGAHRHSR